jgi:twitching motility protein PilT
MDVKRLKLDLLRGARILMQVMTDEEFFDTLLAECIKRNASDLHMTVGRPPTLRIDGYLHPIEGCPVLIPEMTESFKNISTKDLRHLRAQIDNGGGGDFALNFRNMARFRVAVYKQKGYFGMALRLIPRRILAFEELFVIPHLIPRLKSLLDRHG